MKELNMPIDVVVVTDSKGNMFPNRFRLTDEYGEEQTIHIKNILVNEDIFRTDIKKFICQISINNILKTAELRFYKMSTKWILHSIE